MLRYTILDIIINNNDNISQETFECFTEAIEENPKIDIIKYINQEIGEIGDIQLRNFNVARKAVASLYIDTEPDYVINSIIVVCDTICISTI